jgi:hypothetical protein
VQLDGRFGANVPLHHASAHDDRGNVNFCVHFCTLADDQRVVAPDLPAKDAVDTNPPFEL